MLPQEADPFYTYLAGLIASTLILLAFAISIFYHVRKKRIAMRTKAFRDECNLELHKKRIAADLHDDFGSQLTGLKLSLAELSRNRSSQLMLENSHNLLEQSIYRLKEVSLNLVPRELENQGLHAAVEILVERMNVNASIQIKYTSSFDDSSFQVEKAMVIYRIIQEIITNAIKHASSSLIEIGVATKSNRLIVEVRDNGTGFDFETALSKKNSSGLKNIQSRLDLIRAVLTVESEPNKGTHYFISIPLRNLTHGNES